jgi:YVTN family beta-propeller protein
VAAGEGINWIANNDDGTVTRIKPDGSGRTDIRVGKKPFGVTRAGGAVWVANTGSDSVTRIDVKTGAASDPIPAGHEPYFIAADQNTVFVANGAAGDGTITVLDARSGKPVGDPIQVGGELRGIASSGSAVWVADRRSNTVKRIISNRVVKTIKVGKNPASVAFGANALWVTNKDSDTVSRIDLGGAGKKVTTIKVGKQPFGATFGDGFAWITNSGDDTVMRLDPQTGKQVGKPIHVAGQPVGISVARDKQVWVTSNDAGTLTRIDPGS